MLYNYCWRTKAYDDFVLRFREVTSKNNVFIRDQNSLSPTYSIASIKLEKSSSLKEIYIHSYAAQRRQLVSLDAVKFFRVKI
jgi:hypothetical protein